MSVIGFNSIINLETIDSTNNYAIKRLVRDAWQEGTVVMADEQSNGKGQLNNSWESEKGKNLLFSIVLFPDFIAVQQQFELSKVIALAVYDTVSGYVDRVTIKWPNDIYVNNNKISGILIENAILGNKINWLVAGIGLNINQTKFISDAPNPVSLSMITGREYDRNEVLNQFLRSVNLWYDLLKSGNSKSLDKAYLDKLFRYEENACYRDEEGTFTGKIKGVTQLGQLIIEKEDGRKKEYAFKEIAYR